MRELLQKLLTYIEDNKMGVSLPLYTGMYKYTDACPGLCSVVATMRFKNLLTGDEAKQLREYIDLYRPYRKGSAYGWKIRMAAYRIKWIKKELTLKRSL
jgi:hypothetical protein